MNPRDTVERFLEALEGEDLDTVESLLAEDVVYQNVGLPTIRGRDRAMAVFRFLRGRVVFEAKTHRIAADGPAVQTERTDAMTIGPLRCQFWIYGVYEVHDGRITLWRDYFDFFDMFKATWRGVAAIVFPALRQTL